MKNKTREIALLEKLDIKLEKMNNMLLIYRLKNIF